MIPKECQDLINLSLDMALKTDHDEISKANLDRVSGMLNYALQSGDIQPITHASEWARIDLIRALRDKRKNAARI